MPSVTLTGPFGGALEALATLIANSATFQTWTGTASAAAALARIAIGTDLGTVSCPRVIVFLGDDVELQSQAMGTNSMGFHQAKGTLCFQFQAAPDATYAGDPENACKNFMNKIFNVVGEMASLSGSGTYLIVRNFKPMDEVFFEPLEKRDTVELKWTWGAAIL